jgi:hypothetical protein
MAVQSGWPIGAPNTIHQQVLNLLYLHHYNMEILETHLSDSLNPFDFIPHNFCDFFFKVVHCRLEKVAVAEVTALSHKNAKV